MSWLRPILVLALLLPIGSSLRANDPPPGNGCPNRRRVTIIGEPPGPCPNGARRYWYECRDNGLWYCWQKCVDGKWGEKRCFVVNTSGDAYIFDDPTKVTSITCDYDCPPDLVQNVIYGRRRVRTFNCVNGRVKNEVVEVGQCGDPRCKRRIEVI